MQIIININDVDLVDVRTAFLKVYPIPVDANNQPLYTATQWLKVWVKNSLLTAYKEGKLQIARESAQPTINNNIIDVS